VKNPSAIKINSVRRSDRILVNAINLLKVCRLGNLHTRRVSVHLPLGADLELKA
jgi:endonuclease/exonuclease/phosphatase family metal-dependent hydrolase